MSWKDCAVNLEANNGDTHLVWSIHNGLSPVPELDLAGRLFKGCKAFPPISRDKCTRINGIPGPNEATALKIRNLNSEQWRLSGSSPYLPLVIPFSAYREP